MHFLYIVINKITTISDYISQFWLTVTFDIPAFTTGIKDTSINYNTLRQMLNDGPHQGLPVTT